MFAKSKWHSWENKNIPGHVRLLASAAARREFPRSLAGSSRRLVFNTAQSSRTNRVRLRKHSAMSKFTALADPGPSVLLRWPKTVEEPHDREEHKDAGNQYSESHRLALKSTACD